MLWSIHIYFKYKFFLSVCVQTNAWTTFRLKLRNRLESNKHYFMENVYSFKTNVYTLLIAATHVAGRGQQPLELSSELSTVKLFHPLVFWHSAFQNIMGIRLTHFANRKRDRNRIFTTSHHTEPFAKVFFIFCQDAIREATGQGALHWLGVQGRLPSVLPRLQHPLLDVLPRRVHREPAWLSQMRRQVAARWRCSSFSELMLWQDSLHFLDAPPSGPIFFIFMQFGVFPWNCRPLGKS